MQAMLLHEFPYARPAPQPPDYGFGRELVVVRAQARKITFDEHTAPFSIKATLKGEEHYRIGKRVMTVAPDRFLVLTSDQPYGSYIDSDNEAVDSLCIFFADRDVENAFAAVRFNEFDLLDRKGGDAAASLRPRIHAYDRTVTPLIARLSRASLRRLESSLALDEASCALLAVLVSQGAAAAQADRRRAEFAKCETFRRLETVRDYMHENFEHDLRLKTLAGLAGLSPYHFLRRFTELFGVSPYSYLIALRMAGARHLLAVTDQSVSQIALSLGYQDFSAFSRRFRRHFGCSPSAWRAQAK